MKENKEIQEELERLAPGFVWPGNPPGFDMPAGYFSGFPGQVWNKMKALADEATPGEYDKQPPYQTPDRYFDDLPPAVLTKINRETPVARLPRPHPRWYARAAAAAIALLVALSALLMFQQNHRQPSIDQQLASLSDAAIEQYLNTETDAFNAADNDNTRDDSLPESAISQFSKKEIETYLINNVPDSL